jgi:hypothetical protein
MSDNFHIDIASSSREHFEMAMKIAFSNCPGGKTEAYKITAKTGLVLYWSKENGDKNSLPLPYNMDLAATTEFAWNWLKTASYDEEPDHDGSNSHGWRVYNEAWGHVDLQPYAFVGIKPEWMMHGK